MTWFSGTSASSSGTGSGFRWWHGWEGTRENPYAERGIALGSPLFLAIFDVLVDAVVHHWESLVVEWAGGGSSDDNGNTAQLEGRTIRERDNVRQQA